MGELSQELNKKIVVFGKQIFSKLETEKPSAVDKKYWASQMMEWSMRRPELKANLFRLVDVLPSLRTPEAISAHVQEYLGQAGDDLPAVFQVGLRMRPAWIKNQATAAAVKFGVRQMAGQFIAGETPQSSLKALRALRTKGLAFTVDLLGEYCLSEPEAERYMKRYIEALEVFGAEVPRWSQSSPIIDGHPGENSPVCVSVKLSALYSQCSPLNFERSVGVLSERLSEIVRTAKKSGAQIYVDSEDMDNNGIILETFKRVFGSSEFVDYPYPGAVLQAYARSANDTADELIAFAKKRGAPIAIRLVKGAYWDVETITSSQHHWPSPLFSQKESSDAAFEHLSRKLLRNHELILPAFGSHNIRSLSHACIFAESLGLSPKHYEIQALFGMAEPIAKAFSKEGHLVRLYVPLGEMIPGMGYLIRRLLENTSNESFLRHTFFDSSDVEQLLAEPEFNEQFSEAHKANGVAR